MKVKYAVKNRVDLFPLLSTLVQIKNARSNKHDFENSTIRKLESDRLGRLGQLCELGPHCKVSLKTTAATDNQEQLTKND